MNRKEWKREAKTVLKAHYWLLVMICLISAFVSAEFNETITSISVHDETVQTTSRLPSSITAENVYRDLFTEGIEQGEQAADQLEKELIEQDRDPMWGRTRGVLAEVVNAFTSGSLVVTLAATLSSILGSENIALGVLIALGFVLFFLFWFYVQNTYAVLMRRFFLEARIYPKVPLERFLFLGHIKRWTKAALVMMVSYLLMCLWLITIVGFPVQYYAYRMVPFIVAENPDLTPLQVIGLSKRMMKGHKWECFKLDLSFIGWTALSGITFGLSAVLFSNPYRIAAFSSYYMDLRKLAIEARIEGYKGFNDVYLERKADKAILRKAYPLLVIKDIQPKVKGFSGFLLNTFGILLKDSDAEREYELQKENIRVNQEIMDELKGLSYPTRLFALQGIQKRPVFGALHALRDYTIWSLILMFFIFSGIGWVWEVVLHLITEGDFVNRGVMHGPWLPIYGAGGILILTLLKKFRERPVLTFVLILVVCGILEYMTSYVMELNTGLKWWDYSGYFLNLNGRICAEGLFVFSIGGMAFIYVLAPIFDNLISKIPKRSLRFLCITLLICFGIDAGYSAFAPNTGEGITDYD